jgi:hypothetical protein
MARSSQLVDGEELYHASWIHYVLYPLQSCYFSMAVANIAAAEASWISCGSYPLDEMSQFHHTINFERFKFLWGISSISTIRHLLTSRQDWEIHCFSKMSVLRGIVETLCLSPSPPPPPWSLCGCLRTIPNDLHYSYLLSPHLLAHAAGWRSLSDLAWHAQ